MSSARVRHGAGWPRAGRGGHDRARRREAGAAHRRLRHRAICSRVLSDYGHADLAYRLATRTDEPGWGWWIANGHSTMFETGASIAARATIIISRRSRLDAPAARRAAARCAGVQDWCWSSRRSRRAGERGGGAGHGAGPRGVALEGVDGGRLTLTAEVPANASGEIWVPTAFGAVTAPRGPTLLRQEAVTPYTALAPAAGNSIPEAHDDPSAWPSLCSPPRPPPAQEVRTESGPVRGVPSKTGHRLQGHALCRAAGRGAALARA
jgi:hypothetical protein